MVFKKTSGLIGLGLLVVVAVHSQGDCQISFSGKIIDEVGEPLVGATIILGAHAFTGTSDTNGNFRFENICPAKYTLVIQYVGFQTHESNIEIEESLHRGFVLSVDVAQLDEVVIRAHHAQTEHAHNMTTISAKQLAQTAGKSLGETLREIPGVSTIQSGPGIFKPVIHGLHSQRILILNYGIRQEGQQWGAEHAPEIDPFIASNMVVIKDATAIKYGTDALGGVIVVNPPELPEKAGIGGAFNAVAQSNGRSGTLSGYVEGGLPAGQAGIKNHDGWGWRVQGTGKRAGDYHAPDYSLTNTGLKELNFSVATGLHKPDYGFEIFFSRFYTELGILRGTSIGNVQDLIVAMKSEPPLYTEPFSYRIGEPRQEVAHNLLKVNAHKKFLKGEGRLQYGFQQNNRKEFDIRSGSLQSIPALDLVLQTHTVEGEWELEGEKKQLLCIGITGMAQKNTNIPGTQRIPFIPNFASFSGGAFGVAQFFISQWKVDAGLRYDLRHYQVKGYDYKNSYFDDALSFGNVSVTTGASLAINAKQSLHFSASSAWRPPHVAELYSLGTHQSAAAIEYGLLLNDSTNEVMQIGDVPFKNEQALKIIGSHQFHNNHFQNETTIYSNWISNYIYLKPTGITQNIRGVYPYYRYAQTNALFFGMDWSTSVSLSDKFKVKQNVSLLRAINQSGTGNLPYIPPNRFDWSLRFEEPKKLLLNNFFFEAKARLTLKQANAPRVIPPEQIINPGNLLVTDGSNFDFAAAPPAYWLLNVSTGFSVQAGKTKIDFSLAAENLLNQSYREYTNRFRYFADERGRNFIFSIRVNF